MKKKSLITMFYVEVFLVNLLVLPEKDYDLKIPDEHYFLMYIEL
jgi:hypothetical protein